jgi:hypothetical protein
MFNFRLSLKFLLIEHLLQVSLTFNHNRSPGAIYQDKIYLVNDHNQAEIYDLNSGTLTNWTSPPQTTGEVPCMITWQDSFLIFGGYLSQMAVQQFNLTTQQWRNLSAMPIPRAAFGCSALPNNPDKILLVGGDPVQKSAGIYNPVTDTWESAASPSIGRKRAAVVQLGNRIFAVGGQDFDLVNTDTTEEYNVATNSWSFVRGRIVKPKMHFAALVIPMEAVTALPDGCTGI